MKSETFEITEVREETVEQSDEAMALIESLGLQGQLPKKQAGETQTSIRCPYRVVSKEEMFVYGQLYPQHTDVHAYSDGPIPVEVLKTLAFAKTIGQLSW